MISEGGTILLQAFKQLIQQSCLALFLEQFYKNKNLNFGKKKMKNNLRLLLVESPVIVICYVIFLMRYVVIIIKYFGKFSYFQLREHRG